MAPIKLKHGRLQRNSKYMKLDEGGDGQRSQIQDAEQRQVDRDQR